jgi:uncharacterized NAD(P)/FAD-binding protein YdhS
LPAHDGIVAILGTGLTAVDAIITLRDLGWLGSIHANSRHKWFPHAHFRGIEYPEFPPEGVDLATLTLDELQLPVEKHRTILHEQNANPAIIVDKLRPHNQRIWRNFSRDERLAFASRHATRSVLLQNFLRRGALAPERHRHGCTRGSRSHGGQGTARVDVQEEGQLQLEYMI